MLKRILDIIFSFIFVIIFSWLYLIIAICILIDDGFPILYKPIRRGKNKKDFLCYKFRTMKNNKNKEILRTGSFLRKSNLDELPQFFNVIFGSMSVVGPRPHDIDEDNIFSDQIENYDNRFLFKPGITGYAGIKGNRGGTDINIIRERVKLDLFYINNYSFFLDIKIIFFTVILTLSGRKSI